MSAGRKVQEGEKHFCSSVWILTTEIPRKVLLAHHKKLGKWLQPGGHVEGHENPVETAIREVFEETGINISFLSDKIQKIDEEGSFLPIPNFLMEQTIPAYKNEPAHYHIDINYVVKVNEQEAKFNSGESNEIGWFTKKEALKLSTHQDTKFVLEKIL